MRVQTTPFDVGSVTWEVSQPNAARSATKATTSHRASRVTTDLPDLPTRRWITRAL
jgi:hypothetical protein